MSNFLDKFRQHEGDDQLEFWPERQSPWSKKLIIGILAAVAFIVLLATASAQTPVVIYSGAICDEAEEVKTLITTGIAPEGCGPIIRTVGALVEIVEQFEHERMLYTIGRYYIPINGEMHVQYGIMGQTRAPLEV